MYIFIEYFTILEKIYCHFFGYAAPYKY